MTLKELEALLKRKDLRTADRANLVRLYQGMKQGRPLSYQDRLNLVAYDGRYRPQVAARG